MSRGKDWVGMDSKGRPVMLPRRSRWSRARAVLRGWPGLFLVPATAAGMAMIWVLTGAVWSPLVTAMFVALAGFQLGLLGMAVAGEPDGVARRWFYVRVRKILAAIAESAALLVIVGYAIVDPVGAAVPGLWCAIVVFTIATVLDVWSAWVVWDVSRW